MVICVFTHYPLASYLVRDLQMGVKGVSLATSISYGFGLIVALIANIINPVLRKAIIKFDYSRLQMREVLGLGFYNMLMNSLKWYAF